MFVDMPCCAVEIPLPPRYVTARPNTSERRRHSFINPAAVARASEWPPLAATRSAREGRRERSERRGWGGVRCGCCAVGEDSKGQSRGRRTATQGPQGGSEATDQGPQRAARVLATGALEVFTGDPFVVAYDRAAGALEASPRYRQSHINSRREHRFLYTYSFLYIYI